MKRSINTQLLAWKNSESRNPLILNGVRQVGKTFILQELGEQHFNAVHYLNFERERDLARLFAKNLDPRRIVQEIALHLNQNVDINSDLIIFDEIQACPLALTSLKYFCEDLPESYLCAAGSLLGIYLAPVSYPVGKVQTITMHPMSFYEFLCATGNNRLADYQSSITASSEISDLIHDQLWEKLKLYFIVGGLPEVVALFSKHQDNLFIALQKVREKQNQLIDDYYADIAKHTGKINAMHTNRVWTSVPEQLAKEQDGSAKKFKFSGIIPGINRYRHLAGPIDWLQAAGLIIKTDIVNRAVIPLSAYAKFNNFKLYLFDIGLLGALSKLDPKTILRYDYGSYKGYFAENYVAQALLSTGEDRLYSWHERQAEVEFILQFSDTIIPYEVKSGWSTKSKSLQSFANSYTPPLRVKISAKPLKIDLKNKTAMLPLYLADRARELLTSIID